MAQRNRDVDRERFWRLALAEFAASGLNVRAFCAREGLSEPSFYAWRREIARRDADAASGAARAEDPRGAPSKSAKQPQRSAPPKAMPQTAVVPQLIELVPQGGAAAPIEVATPDGFTIRLQNANQLGAVLAAFARRPAC